MSTFVIVCAWCEKVRIENDWLGEPHFARPGMSNLTHGICPICSARVLDEMMQVESSEGDSERFKTHRVGALQLQPAMMEV